MYHARATEYKVSSDQFKDSVQLNILLTHLFPMHSFSIPWKHHNTDVFRGKRESELGTNGLIKILILKAAVI